MHKTEQVQIVDLIELLKKQIWDEEVSVDIYSTSREDSYLSGINEGIDRAYRVLKDFNIKGYLIMEANK